MRTAARRALIAGGSITGLAAVGLVLWTWLPVWAPRQTIAVSPWLDPIMRAAAELTPEPLVPIGAKEDAIGDPRVNAILFADGYVRPALDERLKWGAWFGPEAIEPYLRSEPRHLSHTAAAVLRDYAREWSCEDALRRALDHPDETVRMLAVEGLIRAGSPDAITALRGALDDDSALVRETAEDGFYYFDSGH